MKIIIKKYGHHLLGVLVVFLFLFVIASGNKRSFIATNNVNNMKSIQAVRLTDNYNNRIALAKEAEPVVHDTFSDALESAKTRETSFVGKLTGYGPDCKGCGGGSACRPYQNFKNGNIYFNDSVYGKIRVVAADRSIPCGSIIRINNVKIYNEPIIAVVLDRGGAVKGKHLDLLFESESNMQGFGTQRNLKIDIIRWGF